MFPKIVGRSGLDEGPSDEPQPVRSKAERQPARDTCMSRNRAPDK